MAFCIALHIGVYRHMLQVKTQELAALLILTFFRTAKEFLSPTCPRKGRHDCHYA